MRLRRHYLVLTLLFAALFGIVRGAAQTADALHTHVVCAEHGDLVHMATGQAYSKRSELSSLATDHHDDCAMAAFGAPPVTPLAVPPIACVHAPESALPDLVATAEHGAVRAIPLLATAPKTSPPV
jgi:hypothetical protein